MTEEEMKIKEEKTITEGKATESKDIKAEPKAIENDSWKPKTVLGKKVKEGIIIVTIIQIY